MAEVKYNSGRNKNSKVFLIFGIILACTINLVAWLWVIDWAIWYETPWIYIPLIAWNIEISKGEAINIGYWMVCVSFLLASVSSYVMGKLAG